MHPCIFCEIIAGRSAASLVHDDDRCVAFMDLFPVHDGHALVVPRTHVTDLTTCTKTLAEHLFGVASMLAPAIASATGAAGYNVWTANGAAAGQEIFHLHLHILPRFRSDAFGLRFPAGYPAEADRGDLEATAARIRSALHR